MTTTRCVQNFSRRRALIVSEDARATERLDDSLIRLGMQVVYVPAVEGSVTMSIDDLETDRDVLFLDGDLGVQLEMPRHAGIKLSMIPVVGMVGIEAPGRLGHLFACGATAFIKKPVHVGTVYSTLFMAINEYNQKLAWNRQQQEQEERRKQRRYVIKAVVLLMQQHALTDERAYEWLRRQSMCAQVSVEEMARRIVVQDPRCNGAMQFSRVAGACRSNARHVSAGQGIYSIQESS